MFPTSCCVIVLAPPRFSPASILPLMAPATPIDVHAVVLVEALVLDGDERLADVFRQRADRDVRAHLATDLADGRAVARKHERRLRQRNDLPSLARAVLPVSCAVVTRAPASTARTRGERLERNRAVRMRVMWRRFKYHEQ